MPFEDLNPTDLFGGSVALDGRLPTQEECRRVWRLQRQQLIDTALWAEQWAYSYSGKRYGTALLGYRVAEKEEDRFRIFFGWNCTPFRRPKGYPYDLIWPKPCSERMGKEMAREAGFTPYGFATYSNNIQPDDRSHVLEPVQHPCYECRCMLHEEALPAHAPLMLLRSRLPCEPGEGNLIIVETTFGESCRIHGHVLSERHLL